MTDGEEGRGGDDQVGRRDDCGGESGGEGREPDGSADEGEVTARLANELTVK